MASNYSHHNPKNTGQSNKRKQSSSPKTHDRNSNQSTHHPRSSHNHHHRNRPRSESSSLPTTSQDQQDSNRRPSAPPTSTYSKQPPSSEPPRLSIADRFMAPNFSPSHTTSPALSTFTSNSALSHSAHSRLSDVPTSSSSYGRLSVADKFMNSPTSSTLYISTQKGASYRHSSPIDPVPGKLSIANNFMRHTSDGNFLSPTVGEMDMGVGSKEAKITPSSSSTSTTAPSHRVHPLDISQKSSLFDSDILNLDLSLPPPTISSVRRPFGSQDTLVQSEHKKKPIYAQYIESEKDAALPHHEDQNRYSFLTDEYERRDTAMTVVMDGDSKYDKPMSDKWQYDDEENEIQSDSPRRPMQGESPTTNGCWIGCCFITCRQRPITKKPKAVSDKKRRCGRRGWVICIFLFLILIALIIYFIWPRTPLMRIEGAKLVSPPKITTTQQGHMMSNVAFESEWLVNVTVDNRQNHVPTRLTRVQVLAKDALTGLVMGKGEDPFVVPPNIISTIQLPIHVDYQARDSTDTTFVDLTKSCTQNATREALPLHFWITLHFWGLDWLGYKPTVIATPATGGFACPLS
ncbi:hypothetical protein K501DRAFT_276130 [Backusella circina FSU 941]|nr:hypothetical protein K501DRAFT_276130 [Backusella circina FSU 941]